jgi:hypothetical protein
MHPRKAEQVPSRSRGSRTPHRLLAARHVNTTESLTVEATHCLRVIAVDCDRPDPSRQRDRAGDSSAPNSIRYFPTAQGSLSSGTLDEAMNFG